MANEDDIYGQSYYVDNNNIINPFKIVEEEKLKFVKDLVKCLSKERASDYGKWFDVALCLHNINRNLLDSWKDFSRQASSYDPNVCDNKWESINTNHSGERVGIGSLHFWAKNDNFEAFKKATADSLSVLIDESIKIGAEREVMEETSLQVEFKSILGTKHQHNFMFNRSDFYFFCKLEFFIIFYFFISVIF